MPLQLRLFATCNEVIIPNSTQLSLLIMIRKIKSLKFKNLFKITSCIAGLIFYCEYVIYYLVLMQCDWPLDSITISEQPIKVMFIADTHLLGTRKGHWFDKMRREWEMSRSFQTAINLHMPELVFVLGDLFDEGLWSSDLDFNSYVDTFKYLFSVPQSTELYTVVGNHDIGFHYSIIPQLEKRFNNAFNTSPVKLISKRNVHFLLINSMAMEMDGCFLCYTSELKLKQLSNQLKCSEKGIMCSKKNMLNGTYSKPILLQHFPLYRKNDMDCNVPDSAPFKERKKPFREGWDCLRRDATEKILKMIKPRLVFGGHTHHGCHIKHTNGVDEYSVSSFSWRNKYNPSYMLATFTKDKHAVKVCQMPLEYTIIFIYLMPIIFIIFKMLKINQILYQQTSNIKRTMNNQYQYIKCRK